MLRHLTKFTVSFSEHRAPTLCSIKEIERRGEGLHPRKSSAEGESLRSKLSQNTVTKTCTGAKLLNCSLL